MQSLSIGNYSVSPDYAWGIYEDRKGKAGWIDKDTVNSTTNLLISNLTFTFAPPVEFDSNFSRVMMRLNYLRTYENAGKVELFLCGNKMDTLDARWTARRSLPEMYLKVLPIATARGYCTNRSLWDIELSRPVLFRDDHHDRGDNKFKIDSIKFGYVPV
jgi:hypothetical protein